MSSFAETQLKPAMRLQLVRLARWENLGKLDDWHDRALTRILYRLAPAFAGHTDQQILDRFEELCHLVAEADALADPLTRLREGGTEEDAAVAVFAVDMLLAELVPGEAT